MSHATMRSRLLLGLVGAFVTGALATCASAGAAPQVPPTVAPTLHPQSLIPSTYQEHVTAINSTCPKLATPVTTASITFTKPGQRQYPVLVQVYEFTPSGWALAYAFTLAQNGSPLPIAFTVSQPYAVDVVAGVENGSQPLAVHVWNCSTTGYHF